MHRPRIVLVILLICLTACTTAVLPSIPTIPALPTQISTARVVVKTPLLVNQATRMPTATLRPTRPAGAYLEPTYTPLQPVSPTPTIYLTPKPVMEGPITIGESVEGRAIEAYRFGNGPIKRMLIHGIHGGYEWNTVHLADELIAHLTDHPDMVPDEVTLYIIRNMNPDGYAREIGLSGRTNAHYVDLNRNFPMYWQKEWDREGCWDATYTTGGEYAASEPETQAVMRYVRLVRPTAIISYHSAILGIFPAAGSESIYKFDPDSQRLAEAIASVSTYPYPPIETGCTYTGTLADWAASVGIAAIELELHTHKDTDLEENLVVLEAFLNWKK